MKTIIWLIILVVIIFVVIGFPYLKDLKKREVPPVQNPSPTIVVTPILPRDTSLWKE